MDLPLPSEYEIKARFFPAVIATVPALALVGVLISSLGINLSSTLLGIALAVVLFAFSKVARQRGKRIEGLLIAEMGGLPSTTMLRHRDETFPEKTKDRYLNFVADALKEKRPTRDDEDQDALGADQFYERCGTWLRERTRDTKVFGVLYEENMTYGFWRNLLGLRPLGIGLNMLVVALCVAGLYREAIPGIELDLKKWAYAIGTIAVLHTLCLLIFVNKKGVYEAARQYGRQLILSCETLIK